MLGKRLPGAAPRVSSQHQQGEVNQISLAVTSRTAHQLFSDTFSQLPANSLSCCHFFSVVRGADDVLICVICSHPGLKKDGSSRNHGLLSFIHLSTHPSIHPPIHPSIHPSIHLLTFLSAPFTYLSPFHLLIHPPIHTPTIHSSPLSLNQCSLSASPVYPTPKTSWLNKIDQTLPEFTTWQRSIK